MSVGSVGIYLGLEKCEGEREMLLQEMSGHIVTLLEDLSIKVHMY